MVLFACIFARDHSGSAPAPRVRRERSYMMRRNEANVRAECIFALKVRLRQGHQPGSRQLGRIGLLSDGARAVGNARMGCKYRRSDPLTGSLGNIGTKTLGPPRPAG